MTASLQSMQLDHLQRLERVPAEPAYLQHADLVDPVVADVVQHLGELASFLDFLRARDLGGEYPSDVPPHF